MKKKILSIIIFIVFSSKAIAHLDHYKDINLLEIKDECKYEPGIFAPTIDRNRCEGKADCARVCPVGVFGVDTLPKEMRSSLSFRGKLKGFGHKWQQAVLLHAERCEACGLCVKACPEDALTLIRM